MTIPIGILLIAAAWYCIAHRGTDWPGLLIGVSLGVYTANTILGDIVRAVVTGVGEGIASVNLPGMG
ncbi:MAG: hypothetical protein ACRDPK_00545 [Carbonactinosporaceae bacterium]